MEPPPAHLGVGVSALSGRSGIVLAEVAVTVVILLVAMQALSMTVVSITRQKALAQESAVAAEAARSTLERMRGTELSQLVALYDPDPSNDPGGAGTAPGNRFEVRELSGPGGQPAGEVMLPLVLSDGRYELREDVDDPERGFAPHDLDGDGFVNANDHARDYVVLPVRVSIRWESRSSVRSFDLYTVLVEVGG